MFHPKSKPMNPNVEHNTRPMCVQGDSGLVLTTDPKPRLRWTAELHDRFADAVTQLGGPDKATPKTIMRVMGVKGLTLYHLKSHLQKFRLGKQPNKDQFSDHSVKDCSRASGFELQRSSSACSPGLIGRNMNDNVHISDAIRMQMEVQRRLQEQLEVQRRLQLRIEAQGKYMQNILEKACQTLAGDENNNSNNTQPPPSAATLYKGIMGNSPHHDISNPNMMPMIKDFISPMSLPSHQYHRHQDLSNVYARGGGEVELDLFHQQSLQGFINDESICFGGGIFVGGNRKRPASNSNYVSDDHTNDCNGKSPLIWSSSENVGEVDIDEDGLTMAKLERLSPRRPTSTSQMRSLPVMINSQ